MSPRNFVAATIFIGAITVSCTAWATPRAANDATTATKAWIERYQQAWEHRDAAASTRLFATDAVYRENPFGPSLRGAQAIRRYWDANDRNQRDVHMSYQILSATGKVSLVLWHAAFVRAESRQKVELEGIAEITLNQAGKCVRFREWWNIKPT